MQDFATWIGRLAAAGAAVLAIVWLLEARPPGPQQPTAAEAEMQWRCTVDRLNPPPRGSQAALEAARRFCPEVRPPRTGWDTDLAMRGLLAALAAVCILLLSAMAGRRHD
ncbi:MULTISPECIES: hypothetical protein [Roseomonadaceae]|uniref:Uncharacterized protein n=1 Tax=Falsiroseomonas oleicola TaxID=2801474 RepID=A0ABS6H5L4_9PROT|nr:hypothetical protein [Roseomonas oleicola]MBU8543978.1 hypothetical protein [Roseomonas oleicola]